MSNIAPVNKWKHHGQIYDRTEAERNTPNMKTNDENLMHHHNIITHREWRCEQNPCFQLKKESSWESHPQITNHNNADGRKVARLKLERVGGCNVIEQQYRYITRGRKFIQRLLSQREWCSTCAYSGEAV
jgi:hypothetical protein